MGMTMTQKILARAAGLPRAEAGQLIEGRLDLVLGNDITTPVAITEFEKAGLTQVFDRDKIAIVLDHSTPCKDIKSAQLCAQARERGIRVILDGVFNHTGDDSRYFNKYGKYQSELGAHQSPYSKYSDWYHFKCCIVSR